jgi:hypothetical protein
MIRRVLRQPMLLLSALIRPQWDPARSSSLVCVVHCIFYVELALMRGERRSPIAASHAC